MLHHPRRTHNLISLGLRIPCSRMVFGAMLFLVLAACATDEGSIRVAADTSTGHSDADAASVRDIESDESSDEVEIADTVADLAPHDVNAANHDTDAPPYRVTRTLEVDGIEVEAIIDRPAKDEVDALLLFHGTVLEDELILGAAEKTLDGFRALLDRDDLLLVSVAYPEEGLLMGDNVAHAEAALLWVRRHASEVLGVKVGRVFLAGHSQGGYIVSRLNTLHAVDGVVANAPGPLDLVFRCGLEEAGRLESGVTCGLLAEAYGSTKEAPEAYMARSLLSFTSGHKSDILFVQGLDDSPIQMRSWPLFREQMEACDDCRERAFLELEGRGHQALFGSPEARAAFNAFLEGRRE
jgi:hypothetical protein